MADERTNMGLVEGALEFAKDLQIMLEKFIEAESEMKAKHPEWKGMEDFDKVNFNYPF